MKKTILLFFISIFAITQFLVSAKATTKASKMRVATFNIRLQTPNDSGARAWKVRKSAVAKVIKTYNFDVFGVQELGDWKQENDLKALIPSYRFFGKGRDNAAGTEGERLGVFFKTSRYALRDKGYFFLSAHPDSVSYGWDAVCRRICLWTKLFDRKTNVSFFVFCTHFDHVGTKARTESAKLIIDRIKKIAGNSPVLCVGDLNADPSMGNLYATFSASLKDARQISTNPPKGSIGTFNGYSVASDRLPENMRIDYIWCQGVKVNSYQVITDRYAKETYPSDHFPVMIECEIKAGF